MGERLPDGRGVRVDGEVAQVVGERCVEVDRALLGESQDGRGREDLRDRTDVVRILGRRGSKVGPAHAGGAGPSTARRDHRGHDVRRATAHGRVDHRLKARGDGRILDGAWQRPEQYGRGWRRDRRWGRTRDGSEEAEGAGAEAGSAVTGGAGTLEPALALQPITANTAAMARLRRTPCAVDERRRVIPLLPRCLVVRGLPGRMRPRMAYCAAAMASAMTSMPRWLGWV